MVNHDDQTRKPPEEEKLDSLRGESEPLKTDGDESDVTPSVLRSFFSRRWVFPALYLTAAALIIVFMYSQASSLLHSQKKPQAGSAVTPTVATASQSMIWPVAADSSGVKLLRGFYDAKAQGATVQSLTANLVHYDNSYQGSTGIDLGMGNSHKSFGVVASASGTVQKVENNPVMGETVVVQSANGYQEYYQSLSAVSVNPGEHVLQGQLLGSSGYNMKEAALGSHLFFEVKKSGMLIDPAQVLPKTGA